MLKGFKNILVKELKELIRDPKILIGIIIIPIVMFPALGAVLGYAQQTAIEQAQETRILILNNDNGNWSQILIDYLKAAGAKPTIVNNLTPQQLVDQGLLAENNVTQFIEIPQDFTENMTKHFAGDANTTARVNIYGEFAIGGIFSNIGSAGISSVVYSFNRYVAPDALLTKQSSIIKGEIQENVDPAILSQLLLSQSIILPITIMILLTYSMQIAATSVAMEKEEKTLETLLTVPVDRFSILMGKLSSSAIVAGAGALTYLIGYSYLFSSILSGAPTAGPTVDLAALGLAPTVFGYVLLGITLFVTLLAGLALAVIMSAFAEDVRGATALVGYVYPLIFIPSLALVYIDINVLPLPIKAILFAVPFSQPVIASKAVIAGDYLTVALGIIYVAAFTIVVMYVASRLFATEKILTAKLRFKRRGFGKVGKEEGE
ncbi:MAG TPA: ABC transporter permease [Candidatus Bathyarchaeia archaeon]|nr:ABC transporter permease [Candidatus Bathyarchaeia archaeon]